MTAPLFLYDARVDAGGRLVLDGPEGRHAATVKRLRVGETVDVADGRGRVHRGVVADVGKDRLTVDVVEVEDFAAPAPRLTVVQALPKGERGELAVELLTEVGVDAIVPWAAERCITQWRGDKVAKGVAKWRAAARESTKVARRAWAPEVRELASTASVCELLAAAPLAVVLHETATEPLAALDGLDRDAVLVIGPEGSITDPELAAFVGAGAVVRRMGPTVMRTSTAGAVAASVLLSRSPRWR